MLGFEDWSTQIGVDRKIPLNGAAVSPPWTRPSLDARVVVLERRDPRVLSDARVVLDLWKREPRICL